MKIEVNSVCMRIPFPFIAYTHDDLCQKLETIKGCRIIRRAEFLEEIRYMLLSAQFYADFIIRIQPSKLPVDSQNLERSLISCLNVMTRCWPCIILYLIIYSPLIKCMLPLIYKHNVFSMCT